MVLQVRMIFPLFDEQYFSISNAHSLQAEFTHLALASVLTRLFDNVRYNLDLIHVPLKARTPFGYCPSSSFTHKAVLLIYSGHADSLTGSGAQLML